MDRRSFLKAGAATAGAAIATVNAEAIPLVGGSILDSKSDGFSASHFGAMKTDVRNGRLEGVTPFADDSYPTTML